LVTLCHRLFNIVAHGCEERKRAHWGNSGARAKRLARAQRREDLLDAAVQLILSGGVEAVSVETVADRAGVNRPLVYKRSASKNELLTESTAAKP
jgi:hypothetical protein